MELRRILSILWRRRLVILTVFLSFFVTIMLGTVVITPWYSATSKVFLRRSWVASSILGSLGMQSGSGATSSLSDTDRSDYLALATVTPVAEKVLAQYPVKKLKTRGKILNALPFLKRPLGAIGVDTTATEEPVTAEELVKWPLTNYLSPRPSVVVDQYEDTDLIKIEGRSTDPAEAGALANAMARAFVEEELRRVREDFQGAKLYVGENLKQYGHKYKKALQDLKEFKEREKTVNLDSETAEYIKEISDLKQSQRDLLLSLAETKTKYSANHPAFIDIQNKIDETKIQIRKKMEKVFGPEKMKAEPELRKLEDGMTSGPPAPGVPAEKSKAAGDTSAAAGGDDAAITHLAEKSYKYAELNLAVSANSDIYSSLLKALYQIGIAESISVSNIYVAQTAATPTKKDSGNIHPSLFFSGFIAVFFGGFLAIGSALIMENVDHSMKTPDDMKSLRGLTFLGSVFRLRKKASPLISDGDPRAPIMEAFRTIRNSIRFASVDNPVKSFAVTSSVQAEGKSFFAVNIAISYANEGKKVLLIDGDLRRPSLHEYVGMDNLLGLTNFLAGDRDMGLIQRATRVEGVTLISSGPIPPDPGRLVESKKMQHLLQEMRGQYDMVVVDCPPISAASDAVLLANYTEGIVLIAESDRVQRDRFIDMMEQFKNANITIVGAVMNKLSREGASYYYYYTHDK